MFELSSWWQQGNLLKKNNKYCDCYYFILDQLTKSNWATPLYGLYRYYSTTGIYLSTLCSVVPKQNKQGNNIVAYNFKYVLNTFRILFLGVVHFRSSPLGESMDWWSVFCPSPLSSLRDLAVSLWLSLIEKNNDDKYILKQSASASEQASFTRVFMIGQTRE